MRIVHSADWHLGFRAYARTDARGRNRRELDISQTVETAVGQMLDQSPDLIVLAGDIFHSPRPTPEVMQDALRIFGRLREEGVRTIIAAGNHDLPRSGGGSPLDLIHQLYSPTITVARHAVERHDGLTVVPEHVPPLEIPRNDGRCVAHGAVVGIPIPDSLAWPLEVFASYQRVFLGHYHVATDLSPTVSYSGSLDYVSSDIWSEARSGTRKSFAVEDGNECRRIPVATRAVVDLPVIDCGEMGHAEVERQISELLDGLETPTIARLNIVNIRPDVWRSVDTSIIRHHKRRLFHLQERVEKQASDRPRLTHRSLAEMLAYRIMQNVQDPEDRKAVLALSDKYMTEAEQQSIYRLAETS